MTTTTIRWITSASAAVLLTTTLAFTTGCRVEEEPTWTVRDTPLEVDPLDYVHLVGWWSNGQELLRLETDGRYRLYETHARLEEPLHQGRWEKHTHARLRLEPYEETAVERISVEIRRVDDEHVLRVPGLAEFRKTTEPEPPLRFQPPPFEPMSSNTA